MGFISFCFAGTLSHMAGRCKLIIGLDQVGAVVTVVFVRFLAYCVLLLTVGSACLADPPNNYHATATGKTGLAFRSALHDIIDDHRVIKYSSKNPDTADALAKVR